MYKEGAERFLMNFGVDSTYKGYQYCIYGLSLAEEHPEWLQYITKSIYPDTARRFRTSWNCVERNIRTVVEVVWKNGGREYFSGACGRKMGKRPTNTQFFKLMLEYAIGSNLGCDPCYSCEKIKGYEEMISILEEEKRDLQQQLWGYENKTDYIAPI